jgi:PIN domain nuclease of toxin-antitoxin system
MLIAQAAVEGLALVTTDGKIARYASDRLHVIG